jgi:alanine dehydrogenase
MTSENNLLFLTDADTRRILNWPDAIACLTAAYQFPDNPRATPPRVVARREGAWLRALAAISPSGRYMGAKVFGGSKRGVSYLIALWEQQTGALACLLDAQHVTAVRTAATSALAVGRLTPQAPLRVAVLGSGAEANTHVRAVAAVRTIKSLAVFSPTPVKREDFARECAAELKFDAHAVESAQAAVAGADLVIAAARSRDETPILHGAWLVPGMTVVSIGSTVPEQHEVDVDVVRRSDLIVVDVMEEVIHETGDMLDARAANVEFEPKMATLADLVQGHCAGRRRADEIIMFKSVGSALQDIAVAELCFDRARAQGIGSALPVGLEIKNKKLAAP